MAQETDSGTESDRMVETLVAGRQKRQTAGNRWDEVMQDEVNDDDIALLFQQNAGEEAEDDEFEVEEGAASDDDLGHSGSSDDEGLPVAADEYSGERELQKAEREKRTKERPRPGLPRRPPQRISNHSNPTADGVAVHGARPLPTQALSREVRPLVAGGKPLRSSTRGSTQQNSILVKQRVEQSRERRRRQQETMEAAAKRKDNTRTNSMTQDERLAEAARVELHNSKSLNRWEAAESKRLDEQRAKFAALRKRQLDGPIVTWWSGSNAKTGEASFASNATKLHTTQSQKPHDVMSKVGVVSSQTPPADALRSSHGTASDEYLRQQDKMTRIGIANVDGLPGLQALPDNARSFSKLTKPHSTDSQHQEDSVDLASLSASRNEASQRSTKAIQPVLNNFQSNHASAQFSARNLVLLRNFESSASKDIELQNHVLYQKKKGSTKITSWCGFTIVKLMTDVEQNPLRNLVLLPATQRGIEIHRRVLSMLIPMPSSRYGGSLQESCNGAIFSAAT